MSNAISSRFKRNERAKQAYSLYLIFHDDVVYELSNNRFEAYELCTLKKYVHCISVYDFCDSRLADDSEYINRVLQNIYIIATKSCMPNIREYIC